MARLAGVGGRGGLSLAGLAGAVVAALSLAAVPAAAQFAGGDDNAAVGVNTKDGSSVFKIAFSVRRVTDGVVDQQNAAVAYASCTECQTVAVAIQVILVEGLATQVTPTNLALTINQNCTACETMALAYQFVFGNGEEIEFTHQGRERLKELRKQLHELAKRDDLAPGDIPAALEPITDGISEVLRTELQPRSESQGLATSTTTSTTTSSGPSTTSEPATAATTGATTETTLATTTTTTGSSTTTSTSPPSATSSGSSTTTTGGANTTATTEAGG